MNVTARGLVAGGVATIGMSLVFSLCKRLGVSGEHPPKRVVRGTTAALQTVPGETSLCVVTALAHLGFGATAGLGFTTLHRPLSRKVDPVLAGAGYGLVIWLLSYCGWVPALGLVPPPNADDPKHVVANLTSHVAYGALLGAASAGLESKC